MSEIITRGGITNPQILVCSKCKTPVKQRVFNLYGCDKCDSWTLDVEWVKREVA